MGYPTTTTPCFHVEDDADWREIIEDIVKNHMSGFQYIGINKPIGAAILEIRSNGTAIAIFDLRLDEIRSEYESLLTILANLRELQKQNIEVFIITGHLPKDIDVISVFNNQGISSDRIYDKGKFAEKKLLTELEIAGLKLRSEHTATMSGPW